MTVSRRGQRGKPKMRRSGRNGRVKYNAVMSKMTREDDDRPTCNKISKEEWVVRLISREVGAKRGAGFVQADDFISDILLDLINAGGFSWEKDEIISFCRKRCRYMVLDYVRRQERSECEFITENDQGEELHFLTRVGGRQRANQEPFVMAQEAMALLAAIPDAQRAALEIICDGGNPVDVANELDMTVWAAITLIKEGREYVHRVDPA